MPIPSGSNCVTDACFANQHRIGKSELPDMISRPSSKTNMLHGGGVRPSTLSTVADCIMLGAIT